MFFRRVYETERKSFGSNKILLPYYTPVFCYDYCLKNRFGEKFEEKDRASVYRGLLVTGVNKNEDKSHLQNTDRIINFNGCALDKNGFLENGGLYL